MTAARGRPVHVAALAVGCALLASGCGAINAPSGSAKAQRAQQLVSSAKAAGVAPHLTVGMAESMYGTGAPGVCKVFEDGLTTAERNDLLGNPSGRRPKSITTNAVTYGRLVVKAYCPRQLTNYNEAVNDLKPLTSES
jgi:hypothetical protein